MKRFIFIISAVCSVMIFMVMYISSQPVIGRNAPAIHLTTPSIPDSVYKVFERACMDCHSNDAGGFAKSKVNFSKDKWEGYSVEKKAGKAKAICEVMKNGSMPKKSWVKNNPNDVPTPKEIDMICKWSDDLQK